MKSKYNSELLAAAVARSFSMAQVLRHLGLNDKAGGNYRFIGGKIRELEISTDHFKGQTWAKGGKTEPRNFVPDDEMFVENCPHKVDGPRLKHRLLRKGWIYECQICSIREWQAKALTLHLDHVNGVNNDNRLENLRFLCPNCHQQTHTWGNSYKRKHRSSEGEASEAHERGAPYLISVRLQ